MSPDKSLHDERRNNILRVRFLTEVGLLTVVQHYIPTLLAKHGLEAETDCSGAMTYVHWWGEEGEMHQEMFYPDEVSGDLVEQMRCA